MSNADFDAIVIGAGIIGCAAARALSTRGLKVLIVEANDRAGMGITARNSEVVHSGLYYEPQSLKASLCVRGRELLYSICSKRQIPFRKTGKLIVALNTHETVELERLATRAAENNAGEVRYVEGPELLQMEPRVKAVAGLLVTEAGIVSAHDFCHAVLQEAVTSGATIIHRTVVTNIRPTTGGWQVVTDQLVSTGAVSLSSSNPAAALAFPAQVSGQEYPVTAPRVILAGGLYSDWLWALATGQSAVVHRFVKGEYFSLNGRWRNAFQHLVYPLPEKNLRGLGVHVTIDLAGQARLGPNIVEIPRIEEYSVDVSHQHSFFESARRFLPDLQPTDLSAGYAGIRPKLSEPGAPAADFILKEDQAAGRSGLFVCAGIESPGLTSALAIGELIAKSVG